MLRVQSTSAVLRLECSLDCISGSVGHKQNISVHFLTVSVSFEDKKSYKKINLKNVIGSVSRSGVIVGKLTAAKEC